MKNFFLILTALTFFSSTVLIAEEKHDHAASPGAENLQLNAGKKWATDAPLRTGMSKLRDAVASRLNEIHSGTMTKAQYADLATRITEQTDFIFKNCKLSPKADAQLHLILVPILEGTRAMKDADPAAEREQGAVKVVRALSQYPKYFNHAGWKPLVHH